MADIYGSHFEFSGVSSRRYNLIIAAINTERIIQKSGAIDSITIFNKKENKRHLISVDYTNSPLSFDIEIVTDNDSLLRNKERRNIEKWLFNRRDYRKLYFDSWDNSIGETYEYIGNNKIRSYLNCRFVNPEKLEYNGGIVGYKATLEADSCMLWQDPITKTFTIHNDNPTTSSYISVDVDTDIDDYVYPKVTFTMGDTGGDIIIINHSDDSARVTKFVGLSPFATIIMRSDINYVSGQYYEKFYKSNFVRLLDGINNLSITGDVSTITIEFQNRRYL